LTVLWRTKRFSRMSLKKQSCSTHIFSESSKLEMISVYFATTSGADISYQKCANYSKSRGTHHWSMAVFCVMFLYRLSESKYYLKFSETWEKHGPLFIFIGSWFWPCNRRNKSLFRVRDDYQWTANFDWLHSAETSTGKGKAWGNPNLRRERCHICPSARDKNIQCVLQVS